MDRVPNSTVLSWITCEVRHCHTDNAAVSHHPLKSYSAVTAATTAARQADSQQRQEQIHVAEHMHGHSFAFAPSGTGGIRFLPLTGSVSPFLISKSKYRWDQGTLKNKKKQTCKTHTQRWQGMKVTLPRFLAAAALLGAATAYDTLLTTVSKCTQSKTHCHNGARTPKSGRQSSPRWCARLFPACFSHCYRCVDIACPTYILLLCPRQRMMINYFHDSFLKKRSDTKKNNAFCFKVHPTTHAGSIYWREHCTNIPANAPYIKLIMGTGNVTVTDYFKPAVKYKRGCK